MRNYYHLRFILIGLRDDILNLQEIDDRGHLNVASNVRDLFCKWEEVCKVFEFL